MKERKEQTRAARLRPDQIDVIERFIEAFPELDWSSAIRKGLDLLVRELMVSLRDHQPPVLHDMSIAFAHGARPTPSELNERLVKAIARWNLASATSERKS